MMKKRNKLIALLLVLVLSISLAVPVAATRIQGMAVQHFLKQYSRKAPVDSNVYVYPHAATLDASVVKNGTTLLQFQRSQSTPADDDKFCVEIYKGSVDKVYEDLYYGIEPKLVESRTYSMRQFAAPGYALAMSWVADSRYSVGDYTMMFYVSSAKDKIYTQDILAVDLHVVGQSVPANGLVVERIQDGEYDDVPERIGMFETLCLEPYLVPLTNTADRKITVTNSNPEVAEVYMEAGYVYVTPKRIGRTIITFLCGSLKNELALDVGTLDEFEISLMTGPMCVSRSAELWIEYSPGDIRYEHILDAIEWTSDNTEVATVKDGLVTGISPGTATITAKVYDISSSVEYTIVPHKQPEGLPVSQRTATKPAMTVGPCSVCLWQYSENIIEKPIFTDTNYKAWYSDHVDYVYDKGIMNGTSDTTFAPDRTMTRAELVTVLYRLAGSPEVTGELPFTDTAAGQWYSDAVLWASQNDIVNGVGDNRFAPTDNITREQIATILHRYSKFTGIEMAEGADLTTFPDSGNVGGYAKDAMAWAVAEELITGTVSGGVTSLSPKATATRAQLATIISRYQQMFAGDEA